MRDWEKKFSNTLKIISIKIFIKKGPADIKINSVGLFFVAALPMSLLAHFYGRGGSKRWQHRDYPMTIFTDRVIKAILLLFHSIEIFEG